MAQKWTPDSWRRHEARQLPTYPDAAALAAAIESFGTRERRYGRTSEQVQAQVEAQAQDA